MLHALSKRNQPLNFVSVRLLYFYLLFVWLWGKKSIALLRSAANTLMLSTGLGIIERECGKPSKDIIYLWTPRIAASLRYLKILLNQSHFSTGLHKFGTRVLMSLFTTNT